MAPGRARRFGGRWTIRGAANRHFPPATGSSGRGSGFSAPLRFLGATFVETEQRIHPEPRSAPRKELTGPKRTPGTGSTEFHASPAQGAGIARRALPAGAPQKAPWASGSAARASATGRSGAASRRLIDLVPPAGGTNRRPFDVRPYGPARCPPRRATESTVTATSSTTPVTM